MIPSPFARSKGRPTSGRPENSRSQNLYASSNYAYAATGPGSAHTDRSGPAEPRTGKAGRWVGSSPRAEHWSDRGACKGVDPELFAMPDLESHPKLTKNQRLSLGERRFAEALSYCSRCPVVTQCEDPEDGLWTVRGGVSPLDREAVVGKGGRAPTGSRQGAPRGKRTTAPGTEPGRLPMDLILDGYSDAEAQVALGMKPATWKEHKSNALREYVRTHAQDAVIKKMMPRYDRQKTPRPSQGNGPAWLLATSVCGKVVRVATSGGTQVRTRFLLAQDVVTTRINGRTLVRFPEEILSGE